MFSTAQDFFNVNARTDVDIQEEINMVQQQRQEELSLLADLEIAREKAGGPSLEEVESRLIAGDINKSEELANNVTESLKQQGLESPEQKFDPEVKDALLSMTDTLTKFINGDPSLVRSAAEGNKMAIGNNAAMFAQPPSEPKFIGVMQS